MMTYNGTYTKSAKSWVPKSWVPKSWVPKSWVPKSWVPKNRPARRGEPGGPL